MKTPLVSIIIPTYNRVAYLSRAVRSIQAQTLSDFEIIVVDDHSSDTTAGTIDVLRAADSRLQWIQHPVNKGSQAARNTGIQSARGEWVAFLDSDDEWFPSSLETRLKQAEVQNLKVVYSDCCIEQTGKQGRERFGIPPLTGMVYKELLRSPGPMFQSLLIHSTALKEIGDLDENIISYQEWDTSIRLAKRYEFGFVKEPTFLYYRHKDETISANPMRNACGYEQVVQKHLIDIRGLLGSKAVARHDLKIAVYFLRAKHYRKILRYSWLALRDYMSAT